jgi:hypothetical protein
MTLDYKSIKKEAETLGETLGISAVYIGMGLLLYHGCTDRLPWEKETDKTVTEQEKYESPVNILEIPLQ